jgi:hypothetical protein
MTRRLFTTMAGVLVGIVSVCVVAPVRAQSGASGSILITNARIFTGTGDSLIEGRDVLVEDGIISGFGEGVSAPQGLSSGRTARSTRTRSTAKWRTEPCFANY